MKTTLTIEQSAELIKRGVTKDKASEKERIYKPIVAQNGVAHNIYVSDAPIFTLTDLLSLLPVDVYHKPKTYELAIRFIFEKWHVEYSHDNLDILAITHATELIDALYEMVLWCLDNNHVKLD